MDSVSSSGNTCTRSAVTTLVLSIAGLTSAGLLGYYLGQSNLTNNNMSRKEVKKKAKLTNNHQQCFSTNVKVKDSKALVDVRIEAIRPLVPPACLVEELPLASHSSGTVNAGRQAVANILHGLDDRLVVIVGPCSIHDTDAALEYAKLLKAAHEDFKDDLCIIMRVYFEKPRTTVGWKGLINDPDLNNTFRINKGLRVARKLLLDINELGLPVGCEFLDTISPQFTADLVSWGAIGARTTECQLHRELASGLSMPIGFKNGTGGSLKLAVDAVVSAVNPHCFLSVSLQGLSAIVQTTGNNTCHVILRGGNKGPNYEAQYIDELSQMLVKTKMHDKIMVDCSHGNSKKIHTNQPIVASEVGKMIASGDERIFGLMIESNLVEGNQSLTDGKALVYGKSVTDACIDFKDTILVLKQLAADVRTRREIVTAKH